MSETTFAGVKNTSGGDLKISFNGRPHVFAKDEIRVLEAGFVQFLLGRNHMLVDGTRTVRKYLFQSVPLTEALKHVKEPENRSLAEAKKMAAAETKLRAEIKAEVLAELRGEKSAAPQAVPAGVFGRR